MKIRQLGETKVSRRKVLKTAGAAAAASLALPGRIGYAKEFDGVTLQGASFSSTFFGYLENYFREFEEQTGMKVNFVTNAFPVFNQRTDLELSTKGSALDVINVTFIYSGRWIGAGWVGMLVTSLNLFPAGQLDGGHVAYALSREAHRRLARLSLYGVAVVILIQIWVYEQFPVYVLWLLILLWMRDRHPRLRDEETPLGTGRRLVARRVGSDTRPASRRTRESGRCTCARGRRSTSRWSGRRALTCGRASSPGPLASSGSGCGSTTDGRTASPACRRVSSRCGPRAAPQTGARWSGRSGRTRGAATRRSSSRSDEERPPA